MHHSAQLLYAVTFAQALVQHCYADWDSFVVKVHKEKNKKVAAKEKKHFNIKVEFKLEISENKDKERNVLRIK